MFAQPPALARLRPLAAALVAVTTFALATLALLATAPVTTHAAGTLGLAKDASVAEVSPGESFDYTFIAQCSGLQESCVDATLTDVVPPGIDIVSLPESTDQYTVAYDDTTRTMTVTFTVPLPSPPNPPGSIGLPDGASLNLVLGVELPDESQVADGTVVHNEATIAATGTDPVTAVADVTVVVPREARAVATKAWADGDAVAGTGEASTVTLGVRNASSSTADVSALTVTDVTPAVFERFDVTGIGAVTFPAGTDRLIVEACAAPSSACDEASWTAGPPQGGAPYALPIAAGSITGLRVRFVDSGGAVLPYDPTGGSVEFGLALRDTLRSTGEDYQPSIADVVTNCATPAADDAVLGRVAGDDACASSTVYPAQATVGASKAFFSDTDGNFAADGRATIGLASPVSAVTSITNTSPFPLASVTIAEPSATTPSEYHKVDVSSLRVVFPTGATAATVTVVCAGVEQATALSAPPTSVDLPTGCAGPTADSVRVEFTGVDGDGNATIAAGAIAQLGVHGTLNELADATDVSAGPGASGDGVSDCADGAATSSIDGVGAAAASACASATLWAAYAQVGGTKAVDPPATLIHGFTREFTLSITNSGTIAAPDVVLADPADPNAVGNAFDVVRIAALHLPATPVATVLLWDPEVPGYVAYDAGDEELLARARGFRVQLDALAPGATYTVTFDGQIRDEVPAGTPFQNCAGVGFGGGPPSGFCAPAMTAGIPSSGGALQKSIAPSQSVRPQPGLPGQVAQVKLALQNSGTMFLRRLVATDADAAFYDAVDLTGQVLVNFPPGSDRVRVDACTGVCGDADWATGAVTGSTSPGLPAGVAPGDVRGVRVVFTAVPESTPTYPDGDEYRIEPGTNFPTSGPCTGASVCIAFVPREHLRSAPDTALPATLTNTATGGYESRAQPFDTLAPIAPVQATHVLTDGTARLRFSKSPDRTVAPGTGATFVLRAENTGTGALPDPEIIEPVPAGLDVDPLDPAVPYDIAYLLPAGAPEPPEVVFEQATDPATGRAVELRWRFPGWDLVPGAAVSVQFRTVLAPGVVAGQEIDNVAGASAQRPDLTCQLSGVPRPAEVVDDPAYGDGRFCTSAARVTVAAGNAFRTQKWVAGDPALGLLDTLSGEVVPIGDEACPLLDVDGELFTRYPCVARVLPGQGFDFYLRLTNSGTNPAVEVRVVDVFPHADDTGVLLTGTARGTEWVQRPALATPVALVGKGSPAIAYTSAPDPVCTDDLQRPPQPCDPAEWPDAEPSPATTAFRAIVGFGPSEMLLPGESVALRFRMTAPPDPADATDAVAWNSFGHTEMFLSGASVAQLPPTEPIKVGVAVVYGGLTISKSVVGSEGAGGPGGAFTIDYECTVTPEGGAPALVDEGTVTLAGGEAATVEPIPAGATCRVWELDAHGLISNAPSRDAALQVQIPIGGTRLATVTVLNAVATTTSVTTAPPGPTTAPSGQSTTLPQTTPSAPTSMPGAGEGSGAGEGAATPTDPPNAPAETPATTAPDPGLLPVTGGSSGAPLAIAVLAVLAGAVLLTVRRRA